MKHSFRIGFVDYRPDVGHASTFLHHIRNRRNIHGCDVTAFTALEPKIGSEWADRRSVPYFESIEEFQGKVDAIMIPAASNPEYHWKLFKLSAKLNVPIFVDKPFAEDAATGAKIFTLARERKIPVFSSSALRFSKEVAELQKSIPFMAQVWGGWSEKFDEFIIHPIETAMSLLGSDVQAVRRSSAGARHHIELLYSKGRRGDIYFWPGAQSYEATACGESEWQHRKISSPFFELLTDRIFEMFEKRQPPVTAHDTLAVLKTIDACRTSTDGHEVPVTWSKEELSL